MSLHTFLGVIGYGLIGLFVIGVAVYLVNLPRMRKRQQEFNQRFEEQQARIEARASNRQREFNEAHDRFVKQRADVDQFIRTGKKIL